MVVPGPCAYQTHPADAFSTLQRTGSARHHQSHEFLWSDLSTSALLLVSLYAPSTFTKNTYHAGSRHFLHQLLTFFDRCPAATSWRPLPCSLPSVLCAPTATGQASARARPRPLPRTRKHPRSLRPRQRFSARVPHTSSLARVSPPFLDAHSSSSSALAAAGRGPEGGDPPCQAPPS